MDDTQSPKAIATTLRETMDELRLQSATMADAEFLFRLRTDPETVRQSRGPTPTWEVHLKWLHRTLRDPFIRLYVAMIGETRVGQGRLCAHIEGAGHIIEFSWGLASEYRGCGHASPLIAALIQETNRVWPRIHQVAYIHYDNERSLQSALKHGFAVRQPEFLRLEREGEQDA